MIPGIAVRTKPGLRNSAGLTEASTIGGIAGPPFDGRVK